MSAPGRTERASDGDDLSLEQRIAYRANDLTSDGAAIIVGVSGGLDSIVLLHALVKSDRNVIAAHVNYGLRGQESDDDERFVRSECDRLNIPCRVLNVDNAPTSSIQAWARSVRYEWFERLAKELAASAIAVAHHADDQAETVVINLIRGAGLDGLGGMRPVRPVRRDSAIVVIRPMLEFSRSGIERYATTHGLSWREDASNEHERYLRSRVRAWMDGSSDLKDPAKLASIADRARRTACSLKAAMADLGSNDPASVREGHLDLHEDIFDAVPTTIAGWWVNRILAEMSVDGPRNRDVVAEVLDLLNSQPGRKVEFGNAAIWRQRTGLRFETRGDTRGIDCHFRIGETVELSGGRLVSESCTPPSPDEIELPPGETVVDMDLLGDVLRVRPWRAGDRLQPLGMQGTRKVKDVLTDRRVPPSEKSNVHVVCSDDDIVWIVGADTDHRYRVTSETRMAARIKFLVP